MANFLADLLGSIFTPGPTATLVVATNAAFASLQLCLFALLLLTYSIHFAILSFLCAALWWAINWFVTELEAANGKEKEANHLRELRKERDEKFVEDSGTETEAAESKGEAMELKGRAEASPRLDIGSRTEGGLQPENAESALRKRISLGDGSGDLSTDSEWDKVEEEADMSR